jgi:squalene cyclase
MRLPESLRWLFWEADFDELEAETDADYVLARVLEFGRLADLRWVIRHYGYLRIHEFLRDVGHPELSPRTIAFWRAFFKAENEPWKMPPAWRTTNAAPWPS